MPEAKWEGWLAATGMAVVNSEVGQLVKEGSECERTISGDSALASIRCMLRHSGGMGSIRLLGCLVATDTQVERKVGWERGHICRCRHPIRLKNHNSVHPRKCSLEPR